MINLIFNWNNIFVYSLCLVFLSVVFVGASQAAGGWTR